MAKYILFEIVVLLTNIVQCITGFAGTVLAMPFSIMLVGYETARPILNILGVGASLVIVARDYRHINIKEFLKMAGVMLMGIVAGLYFKTLVSSNPVIVYRLLGSIVIVFAVFSAVLFYTKKQDMKIPKGVSFLLLVISGVVHGMFVCGGPVLVVYASTKLKDNAQFRSTVSAVWLVLNSVIMLQDIFSHTFSAQTTALTFVSLAVLGVAIALGNLIFSKLSRNVFLQITYILMLISGVSLFIK